MAKQQTNGGEWTSGPDFFEKRIDEKRIVKACIATSPDGKEFISVREWRQKADGTPFFSRNAVLSPVDEPALREAFIAALQAPTPTKAAPAKKATAKKAAKAAA
jgi:hypothetical protein